MLDLRRVVEPVGLAVPIDQIRQHVRQYDTIDDVLLTVYARAATETVEQVTGRIVQPQTWEYRLREFSDCIVIPHAPLIEVLAFDYLADGAYLPVAAESFSVDAPSGPGCDRGSIHGAGWPSIAAAPGAVRIRYRAGYEDIPPGIVAAILLLVGSLYENREAEAEKSGTTARMLAENPAFERLLRPYRLIG